MPKLYQEDYMKKLLFNLVSIMLIFLSVVEKIILQKKEDNRNLINEMSEYEFVNRLNDFKSSESEKIGYLTYNG